MPKTVALGFAFLALFGAGEAAAEPPRRASEGLMFVGVSSVAVGTLVLGAGQYVRDESTAGGIAMIAAGTVLIGVGVPLWVYGAQEVPAEPKAALVVGPSSADIRVRF